MKKAVIIMMVVLFSGSAFAESACKNKNPVGLLGNTNGTTSTATTSSIGGN